MQKGVGSSPISRLKRTACSSLVIGLTPVQASAQTGPTTFGRRRPSGVGTASTGVAKELLRALERDGLFDDPDCSHGLAVRAVTLHTREAVGSNPTAPIIRVLGFHLYCVNRPHLTGGRASN
jgi:hypothetical protein